MDKKNTDPCIIIATIILLLFAVLLLIATVSITSISGL